TPCGWRARAGGAVRARQDVPAARASPGRGRRLAPASSRLPGLGLRVGGPPASGRAAAVSIGPRGAACLAVLFLPATIGRTAAAAPGSEPIDRVEVTLVAGSPPCPTLLRDVVAGPLADLTPDLVWVCRERIDPEEEV